MASAASATDAESATKTRDERLSRLAQQITALVAQGRRVESQSDYQAVLVSGHYVWESREIVSVDAWGNIGVQRLGIDKEKLALVLAVVAVFVILIVIGTVHG